MNVVQPDKSVMRDPLCAWHKKKHIKCPTCKTCVFQYDGTPDFSSVQVNYEIVLIITHHVHLQLEMVERVSSFAYPVAVRVHIHLGDF